MGLGYIAINLPIGSCNLDDLVVYMNDRFSPGIVCSYSGKLDKIPIEHPETNCSVRIGAMCSGLLGVRVGDVVPDGVLRAPDGVNMAGTSNVK